MKIKKILVNNNKWRREKLTVDPNYFSNLSKGQDPDILYICSNSRIATEEFMGAEPGDIFIHQNIANMVPNADLNEFEYAEAINKIITDESIENIYIVNNSNSTFIKNSIEYINSYNAEVEKVLKSILNSNKSLFEGLSLHAQFIKLAKLNTHRQAYELLDIAFIGNKINNKQIRLKGLIYDRGFDHFTKFDIDV